MFTMVRQTSGFAATVATALWAGWYGNEHRDLILHQMFTNVGYGIALIAVVVVTLGIIVYGAINHNRAWVVTAGIAGIAGTAVVMYLSQWLHPQIFLALLALPVLAVLWAWTVIDNSSSN